MPSDADQIALKLRDVDIAEHQMTAALDQAIRDTLCVCFPEHRGLFLTTRAWHGSAPSWSVMVFGDAGQVIAHAGVHDRTIRVGQRQMRVGGILTVCVLPDYRGRGLCERVMSTAARVMHRECFDAGMLFCVPALVRVYARSGWTPLGHQDIVRIDHLGQPAALPESNVAMVLPLARTPFPRGPIHLQGNDW